MAVTSVASPIDVSAAYPVLTYPRAEKVQKKAKSLKILAQPTLFECVTFAFGERRFDTRCYWARRRHSLLDLPQLISVEGRLHLETATKLLISLEGILSLFSKCALKSLNNQADFDSAVRLHVSVAVGSRLNWPSVSVVARRSSRKAAAGARLTRCGLCRDESMSARRLADDLDIPKRVILKIIVVHADSKFAADQ
jgi:hypothetical protein